MEREFLQLAKWWMACQFKVMGHVLEDDAYPGNLSWSLLGALDYRHEMRLLVEDWRSVRRSDPIGSVGA